MTRDDPGERPTRVSLPVAAPAGARAQPVPDLPPGSRPWELLRELTVQHDDRAQVLERRGESQLAYELRAMAQRLQRRAADPREPQADDGERQRDPDERQP